MMEESLRYLVTVLLGLALDLGVALILVNVGTSPSLASAVGLTCGAALNFILHRTWTFHNAESHALMPQVLGYIVSWAMILTVRLLVLAALSHIPVRIGDALALFLATGISFVMNFLVLKRFVFHGRTKT